ncbi:two-component system response regulator [Pseudoalteromonas sp. T1lg65]|uniref:two-component system response regulator n=1 Tax=Pseudoalteromonas sp. T1lg65 TaxID=2077101 RepID=UPI003F7B2FA2
MEFTFESRILIVDDELSSILVLEKAVEGLGEVRYSTNPKEVPQLVQEYLPHLIILDIDMGDKSGLDLCKELMLMHLPHSLTVMFVTSHQEPDLEYFSLKLGAVDYITKPVNIKNTRMRVSQQLNIINYQTQLENISRVLHREKEMLQTTLKSIGDGVVATDTEGRVTFLNPIAERMTGWTEKEAKGRTIEEVMELRDATSQATQINPIRLALQEERIVGMALNCQLHGREGQIYRVEDSAAPIRDENGNINGAIIVFHDISESVAMAVKMTYLANNDQLTGLPNRILLHDRISHALKAAEGGKTLTAILMIDIDHFKYINDSLGHASGDALIKKVAKRIESLISPSSTLARIGGDEFVLMLEKCSSVAYVAGIASNLIASFKEPFLIDETEYKITVSIGVSISPLDATVEETMMRHADVAMYRAKNLGRNNVCFFSEELENALLKRHNLEQLLRDSLDKGNIDVFFQPQVELTNKKICGFEALARLKNEEGDFVSPAEFIPLAEELGLINRLGSIVLKKSCAFAKRISESQLNYKVSVNVSAMQINSNTFVEEVADCLEQFDLQSRYLELEVTESALVNDFSSTQHKLKALSTMGLSIAIDDFGTGYSSLSYLKAFPIHVLKIDQSFVKDMLNDEQSLGIVRTIILLAKSLKLNLVAEGVEQLQQADMLKELSCNIVQGYYFSRPVVEQEAIALLSDWPR